MRMLSPVMQHVLGLIKRTGDRCIVVDSAKDEAFVLMSLSGYEEMVNGNHGEMDVPVTTETSDEDGAIENANRAIAHWRDEEASSPTVLTEGGETTIPEDRRYSASRSEGVTGLTNTAVVEGEEDRFYIEPVE